MPVIERHGQIEAWIIDDTGFPKKGKHSVGVARQYCGQRGKQDNCQVAVSLSVANEAASLPIDYRLYLPKDWAGDPARRAKAGVPEAIDFQTKPAIALDQIKRAVAERVPEVVRELHDPQAEPAEECEPVEFITHRPAVLPPEDDTDLALSACLVEVVCRLDLKPWCARLHKPSVPTRHLLAGLLEVRFEMADGGVERVDAAGNEIADVAVGVVDEAIDDEGIVVQRMGGIHGSSLMV